MATLGSGSLVRLCVNFTQRLSVSGCKLQCTGNHLVSSNGLHTCATAWSSHSLLPATQVTVMPRRHTSWFNTLTADQLWKGMLATTGKAQTKARGKRPAKRMKKDLNRGQYIGEGKANIAWPGLNAPLLKDRAIQTMHVKEPDPEKEERLLQIRSQWDKKKKRSIPPEQRGWTSKSWGGRRLGPPDPIPGETFEGFDSSVITVRRVFNMTGAKGRKRSMSALVVVGNKNGAIGYAHGKAPDVMSALRKAKNKAANYLHYIERYQDHTVYHDIESTFQVTRIRIRKQNRGYGLRCHRILKEICRLAGIKDLYARVHGSTNPINVAVAFINGLVNQETHQQIADRKGLHVVEFRKECGALPIVVASPQNAAPSQDVDETAWDKELPLEWKEELPKKRVSHFAREGTIFF